MKYFKVIVAINNFFFFLYYLHNIEHLKKDNGSPNNSKKSCLNGGLETTDSKCFCPPGFVGEFCETGNWICTF